MQDLRNIRLAAGFLQSTELKFDLVSPVDELAKQIKIEFDFRQEAAVMNSIGDALEVCSHQEYMQNISKICRCHLTEPNGTTHLPFGRRIDLTRLHDC
jgi:predicted unusual protein kinase regulating ubiquinone biosynthesis (AarF/ABC1/UbiB family)